jgi:hypothetical protein
VKHALDMKRARIGGQHLFAQNDPVWPNEGSDSEECREATERILRGPWGWLLVIASAVIVALAFNGGYYQ